MYGSTNKGWDTGPLTSLSRLNPTQIERLNMLGISSVAEFLGVLQSGDEAETHLADYLDVSVEHLDSIKEEAVPYSTAGSSIQNGAASHEPIDSAGLPRAPMTYPTGALEHRNDAWPYAVEPPEQSSGKGKKSRKP